MSNSTQQIYKELPSFIQKAIDHQIEQAVDEEMEKLKQNIDKRKSEIITGVLLHIQKQINFTSMTDTLQITVRLN